MAERDESGVKTAAAGGTRPSLGIFMNYRRKDDAGHAGRLYDSLVLRFGKDAVFMDVDRIRAGRNWRHEIDKALETSDACLVVIGRNWLTIADDDGRRLDDADDACRREIEGALERKIPVIPVLVGGARMPEREALPQSIAALADIHAFRITHANFGYEVGCLLEELETLVTEAKPAPPPPSPNLPIAEVGLSTRATSAVGHLGVRTLGDLTDLTDADLKDVDSSVREEIEQELAARGLGTRRTEEEETAPAEPSSQPVVPDDWKGTGDNERHLSLVLEQLDVSWDACVWATSYAHFDEGGLEPIRQRPLLRLVRDHTKPRWHIFVSRASPFAGKEGPLLIAVHPVPGNHRAKAEQGRFDAVFALPLAAVGSAAIRPRRRTRRWSMVEMHGARWEPKVELENDSVGGFVAALESVGVRVLQPTE